MFIRGRRRPLHALAAGVLAAAVLAPSAAAAPAHAHVVDPANDTPYNFEEQPDVTSVDVMWDADLVVRIGYAVVPPRAALRLLVSAAARDELDPERRECDPEMADSLTVMVSGDTATLTDTGIAGALTALSSWDGATVSYTFASPTLVRRFADNNNGSFVCISGIAGDDEFYGGFDGKVLKLTAQVATAGVNAELARRFGRPTGTQIRCLSRGKRAETADPYEPAKRWCGYRTRLSARTVAFGETAITLAAGVPRADPFSVKRLPSGSRECGTTEFTGSWLLPPFPENFGGASTTVWAKGTSCRTARRVALGRVRGSGFRCRATKRAWEFVASRCTAAGGRVVWVESGS